MFYATRSCLFILLEVATQLSRWTNFCLELAELYLVKHKFKRAKAKAVQASQA